MPDWVSYLPHFHASCNLIAAFFQIIGWRAIRANDKKKHIQFMMFALMFSCLFLMSYLTYHYYMHGQEKVYTGPLRPVYLTMLISHIVLAVVIIPMIIRTLYLVAKNRLQEHVTFGRITLATWLYVSLTGVLIYVCVFHISN